MTQAEKILAGITDEAKKTAESNIQKANYKADEIIADAEEKCALLNKANEKEIERQQSLLKKTGESSAALIMRDAALRSKRDNIEAALTAAQEKILNMQDKEYFDFLSCILKNTGCTSGTVSLNSNDLKRNTADFEKLLNDNGIALNRQAADIEGGFILKNGDIEINASIAALIREKHGELVDNVNRILFNREDEA